MSYHKIHIGEHCWHFQSFGEGAQLLITFHGFGEDSSVFRKWKKVLGSTYTIVAVDLPFHGKSTDWKTSSFEPVDFLLLIEQLAKQYQQQNYSLLGHSLGARVLLDIWHKLEIQPISIWLLAPDGIATRRLGLINRLPAWCRTVLGNKLENWHHGLIRLADRLHKLGWIDIFSLRYLRYHLANRERRQRLMAVWKSVDKFPVNKDTLVRAANNESIPIHLVLGKADKIIDWSRIATHLEKYPPEHLHYLETGHQLINEETAQLLLSAMTSIERD